jgi:hypothetical protein
MNVSLVVIARISGTPSLTAKKRISAESGEKRINQAENRCSVLRTLFWRPILLPDFGSRGSVPIEGVDSKSGSSIAIKSSKRLANWPAAENYRLTLASL